jgi:hypothetical protein
LVEIYKGDGYIPGSFTTHKQNKFIQVLNKTLIQYKLHTQHQFRAILQRLCQMRGLDLFTPCQIRDGARQFQDAMIALADKLCCIIATRIKL